MDTTQAEVITRLKRALELFLDENFVISNNVYFEKLLTNLAAKEQAYLLKAPFAVEWVDRCLSIISEDLDKVNPKVVSFMLNLCGLLATNEWNCIDMRKLKILDRVLALIDNNMERLNPSMKLGCTRLLACVSRYTVAVGSLRTHKVWRFLIAFCNKDHTLYVVREARKLLYELLYMFDVKLNDEQTVVAILEEIFKPVMENIYQEHHGEITINVDDAELQHRLSSTLDLISYVFQQTLSSDEKTNIARLCKERYDIDMSLWKLTDTTLTPYFLEKILNAQTSYNFANLVQEKWTGGQIEAENFNTFGILCFNIMKFCISTQNCNIYLKLAELNYILWKQLGQRVPKEIQIENERVSFENQMIMFQLMPLMNLLKSDLEKVDIFDSYVMTLFEISCEQTMRLCYTFRDMMLSEDGVISQQNADLACRSIYGIMSMESVLQRDQAILVFQTMMYALNGFTLTSDVEPYINCVGEVTAHGNFDGTLTTTKGIELINEMPNVLYAALVGLQRLIQRYDISWKESIESLCVVNFVAAILMNQNLTSRLVVQALKLVQLAVEHFLSPNMALLVDNLQGSGLVFLGPIIVKRCHDTEWEVRDSALELVTSIATISRLKFSAFQKLLLDNKICPIVYQMAQNDSEAYVRASAIKCLSQMVKINLIWEQDLVKTNLLELLFFVLYNESEGIVRKEAIDALAKIYVHRKIPIHHNNTLYSTLTHCAVDDLHWEVKVGALHFWELEIQQQFTNQGMIDGTFPTVTFSREHKKIVTLTEKEINLRIIKIFNELSMRGCLGVILKCLSDDCDPEVIKTAACMVKRLLDKLQKYEYETIIGSMDVASNSKSVPPALPLMMAQDNDIASASGETAATISPKADDVIDSILAAHDINLLMSAYEEKMNLNDLNGGMEADNRRTIAEDFYKSYTCVGGKEFVESIKRIDVDALLQQHQVWSLCTESFMSLLDDLLTAIEPSDEEAIFADCY